MAGSPVYGKGYHAGKQDARTEDLIAAGVLAAAGLVIAGGVKVYRKVKEAHATRLEQRLKDIDDGGNSEDSGQQ
ncbi:hypothetical protein [Paenarthrobacter ureafaciens]|uniref:hypothetical protein n=1 Tax=Paenarthrobacter ureafaciens TaxID=37931 RepID=UPI00140C8A60|nr:hypothetical protein [Paenarthrobacter ureafaciens]MCX8452870.1 hypothetical protein [Paenarthrobacter ureafaciens]MCY0971508.1 hypothetical protein [Paenarthrobacter ureafaciens]